MSVNVSWKYVPQFKSNLLNLSLRRRRVDCSRWKVQSMNMNVF